MSWGRRTAALVVLATTSTWLVGCGTTGGPEGADPTPVVIPGSTVTIGTDAATPVVGSPSPDTTSGAPGEGGSVTTVEALFTKVGGAMGGFDSVHLAVGTADEPSVIEANHHYLSGGSDYSAVITAIADQPVEARRVGGTFYLQSATDGPFTEIDPADVAADDTSVIGALPGWDVLGDLAAVLGEGADFAAGGPGDVDGTPVQSFTFTADAADLVPSAQVPDDLTGAVEVTFSIDEAGLPVRVDEDFADGDRVLRTDYSGWGDPFTVEVPSS
ncbi:hypothetical protein [Nocardioides sp.]|uniref:hypothetical protein n=1 Tax=Nocardioides sp. TaxID=35761 RepID=UPI0027192BFF|nr:hypothetical protein [Nocardioides sp.]MDO9454496.1 hypothetical protein [Nocardioides sp.]